MEFAIILFSFISFFFFHLAKSSYKKNKNYIFIQKEHDFRSYFSEARFFFLCSMLFLVGSLMVLWRLIAMGNEFDLRYVIFPLFASFVWWATLQLKKEFLGK